MYIRIHNSHNICTEHCTSCKHNIWFFKGTLAWDFQALVFSWIKNGPLINTLKYFSFCRDIHENIFDFRVTIPKNLPIAGYHYPEITTKKPYFIRNCAKTKQFSKIFWGIYEKTRHKKSHASVPLIYNADLTKYNWERLTFVRYSFAGFHSKNCT